MTRAACAALLPVIACPVGGAGPRGAAADLLRPAALLSPMSEAVLLSPAAAPPCDLPAEQEQLAGVLSQDPAPPALSRPEATPAGGSVIGARRPNPTGSAGLRGGRPGPVPALLAPGTAA